MYLFHWEDEDNDDDYRTLLRLYGLLQEDGRKNLKSV